MRIYIIENWIFASFYVGVEDQWGKGFTPWVGFRGENQRV